MRIPDEEKFKRRRELTYIFLGIILLSLLVFVEFRIFHLLPWSFSGQNLIIFALIQLNLILLLLVTYLVLRNVLKTLFEARASRISRSLQVKLVFSFLLLSFLPALILFVTSHQFIETSLEYWFGSNLDQQMEKALIEARAYYQDREREILLQLQHLEKKYLHKTRHLSSKMLKHYRRKMGLDTLEIYDVRGRLLKYSYTRKGPHQKLGIPPSILNQVLSTGTPVSETSNLRNRVLLRVFMPTTFRRQTLILAGGKFLDPGLEKLIKDISSGVGLYQQLKFLRAPLKTSLLLLLLLVTLLTIFVGVWFGMRLARGLTGPLQELALAADRIAAREFEVHLPEETPDEVGVLVRAFRRMTEELKHYRTRVEETTRALAQANEELKRRTAYLETILFNITAGVMAIDQKERLTLINQRARELLDLPQVQEGPPLKQILSPELYEIFRELKEKIPRDRPAGQPLRLVRGDKTLVLGLTGVRLPEEAFPGYLFLVEDLTEKERMERLAAWREVARRIAHEVKNPLTPIQLSAQRLRRRLVDHLSSKDREILERCTTTIEKQVEELKRLVNEFSAFARLPGLKPEEHRLSEVIREVVTLYQEAHRGIHFQVNLEEIPPFLLDRDQMKRVFLNLFDNAIAAMGEEGEIRVEVRREGEWVRIEVADTGPGIPPEIRPRLFEPYASGKGGTGLGLAIVHSIVQGHGGEIRAEENSPHGARFVIRLPLRRKTTHA